MSALVCSHCAVRTRRSVHGLNLTVPEDAKAIIKPWDQRDDTERYAESGVDDQVRGELLTVPASDDPEIDDHTHSFHSERKDKVYLVEAR